MRTKPLVDERGSLDRGLLYASSPQEIFSRARVSSC